MRRPASASGAPHNSLPTSSLTQMCCPHTSVRPVVLFVAAIALCLSPPSLRAQQAQPTSDPFGLTALNSAYRLKLGDLSLDLQQGGMSTFQPFIYPLLSANGVEVWGKDESFRADHLQFYIRYGSFVADGRAPRIRDTDVPNLIGVSHTSNRLDEHLGHQARLRTIRDGLGAPDACARDTAFTPLVRTITVSSVAGWKRPGGTVLFTTRVTHREPFGTRRRNPVGLYAAYEVVRTGALPTAAPMPTRLDTGCSIERDELEALAAPLDTTAFRALRDRLQKR